jgi:hypothetical protein
MLPLDISIIIPSMFSNAYQENHINEQSEKSIDK